MTMTIAEFRRESKGKAPWVFPGATVYISVIGGYGTEYHPTTEKMFEREKKLLPTCTRSGGMPDIWLTQVTITD